MNQQIGLYNLEPKIFNTALMQVSQYHKLRGDHVEPYNHLQHARYDRVYAFSIFDFTDKSYVTGDMIQGGTGFDPSIRLPSEIEACDLDYAYYPSCETSYLWFSRGCIRQCPFCVVPEKEGWIHPVTPKNLNPRGTYITVMDNSFFANPRYRQAVAYLLDHGQPVDIEQGFDLRGMNRTKLGWLSKLWFYKKRVKFAWDNPKEDLVPGIKKLTRVIAPHSLMCYVLIGYWSTPAEDLYRVQTLKALKIDPFVMPYHKGDPYQRHFARWVNHPAVFHSVSWPEYWRTKMHIRETNGITCLEET